MAAVDSYGAAYGAAVPGAGFPGEGNGGNGGADPVDPATAGATAIWDTKDPGVVVDPNGVNFQPDAVGSLHMAQTVNSLKPAAVTGGHQADTDDFLDGTASGTKVIDIFTASALAFLQVIKMPASISTNITDPQQPFFNEASFGSSGGRIGLYYRSAGPTIGAFIHDGIWYTVELPVAFNTSYVVGVTYDNTTLGINLDGGVFETAPAGDLSATGGTIRLHQANTVSWQGILAYTCTFNAPQTPAEMAGYAAFLDPLKP